MGVFAVDFRERARNWWALLVSNRASFEGRRDGGEGQGAGVVQRVWMGVEMWERGLFGDRDPTAIGCPIFATVSSSIRWAIARRRDPSLFVRAGISGLGRVRPKSSGG